MNIIKLIYNIYNIKDQKTKNLQKISISIYIYIYEILFLKLYYSLSPANSDYSNVCIYCKKKLLEFPVERDLANEKAFNATQYTLFFQLFFRILFFDIEVRFFGAAIPKLD